MSQSLLTKPLYWPHLEEEISAVYLFVDLSGSFSKYSALVQLDITLISFSVAINLWKIWCLIFFHRSLVIRSDLNTPYSVQQSPSWEANRFSASQEIPRIESEVSLPYSQVPATCPYPETDRLISYPIS